MNKPNIFVTLKKESHTEFEEKRSVFIGHALRTDTEEEAMAFIKQIKKQYSDATHNVYAYLMQGDTVARYSDDGEPQGTAGMPVLDVLRKSGVRNACVVVTRYFGGTLLGAGGLVRAYSHSAALAIEAAEIVTYEAFSQYELSCSYSDYQKLLVLLPTFPSIIDSTDFAEAVTLRFAVKQSEAQRLADKITELTYGKAPLTPIGSRFDCL